ncbi:sensor histidine kinase [Lactiplantibacillus daowaiensis]|uniref:Sensor histidine kinase n=1 Tax=Lactiplantibacillus daowaiensis TaxID=2559918 RepID=A0ABW1RZK2_9LACO|nr:sensor histidine kinase [Lactiplantibacillus daowaiensis]
MRLKTHIKQSSFARLIKVYTAIISVMVVLATSIFVMVSIRTYNTEVEQAETTAQQLISRTMAQNQQVTSQIADQITSSSTNLTSIEKYFSSSISAYSNYAINKSIKSGQYFFWPTETRHFFLQHDQVAQITLRLNNRRRVFMATATSPGGALYASKAIKQKFAFRAPLINQLTLDTDGVLSVTFDQSDVKQQLRQLTAAKPIQVSVQSDANEAVFYFAGKAVPASQKQAFKRALSADNLQRLHGYHLSTKLLPSGYRMTTAINRAALSTLVFSRALPLIFLGLILLFGLNMGLWLTFRRYQHQLDMIVDTVETVSNGNFNARVPVDLQPTDLQTLADGINHMLIEIHQHIYTIYQLQIAQQEANRKALQAQINPHFMSNTLEYIRMAALEAHQPELAQVVYSFAALLRNNTDLSPRTTIKKELSFIEKYVFLYQVRFPDRLAYQFEIAPDVAAVELPKFSLQPLVENYFVHGVDFARQDNALSVKAWRADGLVHITIKNNGRGLTPTEVTQINEKMRQPLAAEQQKSIGLQNVYSRLADTFGDSLVMTISSAHQHGVIMQLTFDDQRGDQHD